MSKRNLAKQFRICNITISYIIYIMIGTAACNKLPSLLENNHTSFHQNIVTASQNIPSKEGHLAVIQPINISTCFTPPAGCTKVITDKIDKANHSIYVQAYGFTDVRIANSLIAAYERGVKISILLDKSNLYSKYSQMSKVQAVGIEVSIDKVPGIAHNKVMIIDQYKVITGSFNFSKNADQKNAENVIIIKDPITAKQYFQNWLSRKHSNNTATPN